jgi:hypothetical protein
MKEIFSNSIKSLLYTVSHDVMWTLLGINKAFNLTNLSLFIYYKPETLSRQCYHNFTLEYQFAVYLKKQKCHSRKMYLFQLSVRKKGFVIITDKIILHEYSKFNVGQLSFCHLDVSI